MLLGKRWLDETVTMDSTPRDEAVRTWPFTMSVSIQGVTVGDLGSFWASDSDAASSRRLKIGIDGR